MQWMAFWYFLFVAFYVYTIPTNLSMDGLKFCIFDWTEKNKIRVEC